MFTGIVQAIGRIEECVRKGGDAQLRIATGKLDLAAVKSGDSIAVSGVCLTVTALDPQGFSADVSAETLRCTTLSGLKVGDAVNLEKALTLSTPLGGHLVSGHVDGVAKVRDHSEVGQSLRLRFEVPAILAKYIAPKGSVCIDGVSLTVNEVQGGVFSVNLVPHTLAETTLGTLEADDDVNVEVDLMARYAERLLFNGQTVQGNGVLFEVPSGATNE